MTDADLLADLLAGPLLDAFKAMGITAILTTDLEAHGAEMATLRAENERLKADVAKVTEAVAEGGWSYEQRPDGTWTPGPTADDAARVIREFHTFREDVWNQDAVGDEKHAALLVALKAVHERYLKECDDETTQPAHSLKTAHDAADKLVLDYIGEGSISVAHALCAKYTA